MSLQLLISIIICRRSKCRWTFTRFMRIAAARKNARDMSAGNILTGGPIRPLLFLLWYHEQKSYRFFPRSLPDTVFVHPPICRGRKTYDLLHQPSRRDRADAAGAAGRPAFWTSSRSAPTILTAYTSFWRSCSCSSSRQGGSAARRRR